MSEEKGDEAQGLRIETLDPILQEYLNSIMAAAHEGNQERVDQLTEHGLCFAGTLVAMVSGDPRDPKNTNHTERLHRALDLMANVSAGYHRAVAALEAAREAEIAINNAKLH